MSYGRRSYRGSNRTIDITTYIGDGVDPKILSFRVFPSKKIGSSFRIEVTGDEKVRFLSEPFKAGFKVLRMLYEFFE